MKNELWSPCAGLTDLSIKVHFLPLLKPLRLALGQAGLHWERRLRQVQGTFVITHIQLVSLVFKFREPGTRSLYVAVYVVFQLVQRRKFLLFPQLVSESHLDSFAVQINIPVQQMHF